MLNIVRTKRKKSPKKIFKKKTKEIRKGGKNGNGRGRRSKVNKKHGKEKKLMRGNAFSISCRLDPDEFKNDFESSDSSYLFPNEG